MKRYSEAAARVAGRVMQARPGVGLVVCAFGEQGVVGAAVAAALGWQEAGGLAEAVEQGGRRVVAGLAVDDGVLERLNGSRDRLAGSGALLVVMVSQAEMRRFVRLCGDVYATVSFVVDVPFEADGSVSIEEGRRQLAAVYERRFGRLDLRGLIRRGEEDVGWPIEALYQPMRARAVSVDGLMAADGTIWPGTRWAWTLDRKVPFAEQFKDPGWSEAAMVLLGGPGSGKSFFLRWCARSGAAGSVFGIAKPLPVLVPLAAFAAAPLEQSLLAWVLDWLLEESPAAAHALPAAIEQRQAVFLLDGLDEAGTERGRARCVEQVQALMGAAPGCPVLVTSRPAGFGYGLMAAARVVWVEPFDGEEIARFLEAWGRQYAIDARGATAADAGAAEGRALAAEIGRRPAIKALAETPLLLTVLALVHRMGVRLPEHRIELYSQITLVLVERWNQVRSLAGPGPTGPLRVGDAIRLLGPLAWGLIERGERGAIDEAQLVAHVEGVLAQGTVRGFASAHELVEVFRSSLGLLVEQAPGRYAFAHSTLVEYFAARELVRGRGLERLVASERVFDPGYHEVIRLALAEVGQVQLDDERLTGLVTGIVAAAHARRTAPVASVPALLMGLWEDELVVGRECQMALVEELLPYWVLDASDQDGIDSDVSLLDGGFSIAQFLAAQREALPAVIQRIDDSSQRVIREMARSRRSTILDLKSVVRYCMAVNLRLALALPETSDARLARQQLGLPDNYSSTPITVSFTPS